MKLEVKRIELEDDPDAVRSLPIYFCSSELTITRAQDVIPIFPDTNTFIDGGIKSGGTVLVHWYAFSFAYTSQNTLKYKIVQ